MEISTIIDTMRDELVDTLNRWIAVPSVKADALPGAPFGEEVKRMLHIALEDGEKMGFAARNIDEYAGDLRMGPIGVDPLGILAHLDVVPAGDGWQTQPFEPTQVGDRIYGRGTSDDKGPAIAALFAMKAIKEAGIPLKREVRLILGCDEESGWEDMRYYCEHCDMPKTGFSPDASFPVINTEKGMLHLSLRAPYCADGLEVKEINVGERCNVIPGNATALIGGTEDECEKINRLADDMLVQV